MLKGVYRKESLKPQRIYIPAKLYDAGGDPMKPWYVFFSYRYAVTGKMVTFRLCKGLTPSVDIQKKYDKAEIIIQEINQKLENGYNPFNDGYIQLEKEDSLMSRATRSQLNWENCLNEFIDFKKTELLEEDSIRAYHCKVKRFCQYLKEIRASKFHVELFTYKMACDFMMWLSNHGCKSKKTLREYRSLLCQAAKYLQKREILKKNVFELLPNYKSEPQKPLMFTVNQIKKLKAHLIIHDRQMWTIMQFVLYCFFRPNKEVRLMKIKQIDFQRGLLHADPATAKNNRAETVVIPESFLEWLKEEGYNKCDPNHYMFTISGRPGETPIGKNYINKRFHKLARLLGINTYLYALKHTGNKMMSDKGVDIPVLMKQNRHKTLNQTYEYMKTLEEDYPEEIRGIEFGL